MIFTFYKTNHRVIDKQIAISHYRPQCVKILNKNLHLVDRYRVLAMIESKDAGWV